MKMKFCKDCVHFLAQDVEGTHQCFAFRSKISGEVVPQLAKEMRAYGGGLLLLYAPDGTEIRCENGRYYKDKEEIGTEIGCEHCATENGKPIVENLFSNLGICPKCDADWSNHPSVQQG